MAKHQVAVRFSFFIITQTDVKLKILYSLINDELNLAISFFPSAAVLERESSES